MRFFAGNKLASFFRLTSGVVEDTTGATFDSAYVANSIKVPDLNTYFQTAVFLDAASTTLLWTHCEFYTGGWPGGTFPWIEWVNSVGTVVAQLVHVGSNATAQFQYWNGSAFANYGSAFTITDSIRYQLDIKITCGAAGTVDIYLAGNILVASASSGMNAAVTNIAAVRFRGAAAPGNGYYSQIIGGDFDTRNFKLLAAAINGNGADTAGTGTYTDINETPLDESTAIVLPAVGNAKSFTHAAVTVPNGTAIDSAWVTGRGRVSGGVVTDGKLGFRSSGTDYVSAGKVFNGAYEPRQHYTTADPATAAAWTQTSFNNAELVVKAA